ncbi:MAG: phosphoribosylformylglycinamidine synthase [bacterium]|nr:phosphoribosylformylglycinamidine synthase [bacterium]
MTDAATQTGNLWQVVLTPRSVDLDAHGRDVLGDIHRLGLTQVGGVRTAAIYFLSGRLDADLVARIGTDLLADPVVQHCTCSPGLTEREPVEAAIEVHHQPGVMDPTALSARDAIRELIETSDASTDCRVDEVRTARRYVFEGLTDVEQLERIARRVLANSSIETAYLSGFGRQDPLPQVFPQAPVARFELRTVALRDLDDTGLAELSRRGHLFLSLPEMEAIREHFRCLDRDPTDLELETLAQTWSEHCVHKTLKSAIVYHGPGFDTDELIEVQYDNLLADTIVKATRDLNRPWCLSVFEDNAGVIAFDDDFGVAFKVETHNHPSALEPYGGAATGIGGCIRDIMGCGLGAKPIASTDVFCFAPPDTPEASLPRGVLHPRRVFKGVVGGVRDYGNRMGIPTVNGAVYFDRRYLANPLVFCGCVGLIPRNRIAKTPRAGDRIVLVGGRTGRDGIHGATFSSAELTDQHVDEFSHAVQIGNPITEKKTLDGLLRARDHDGGCLYSAVTDCGAGGLSSAVGEMAAELGAQVDLEKVPLKYAGLRYDEIWISEAQERMVLAVPPENLDTLLQVFEQEEVETAVIGAFTGDGQLVTRYQGIEVGRLEMTFLHDGLPKSQRTARWTTTSGGRCPAYAAANTTGGGEGPSVHSNRLLQELADYNVASKEWVIRQYDHEVQGGSVVKPLCGPGDGPSDAAVLRPRLDSTRGIALGCGMAPDLFDVDPYWMAIAGVDEALRNVVCVGGDPVRTAVLDNFCWGGVDSDEALGGLVRACQGAHDAAVAYGLPFISGKDSLNNQFSQEPAEAKRLGLPERWSIPGTLLISALAIVEDVRCCVTMDLKQPGNRLILVQPPVEDWNLSAATAVHHSVAAAIRDGKVHAAHDVSDGGLAVALAEMCIAGDCGARIRVDAVLADRLFSPVLTGYCLEVDADHEWPGAIVLGTVTAAPRLLLIGGKRATGFKVAALRDAWQSPLRDGPGGTGGG